MNKTLIAKRNNPFFDLKRKLRFSKYLLIMIIPAIIFYFIFNYVPMYGILIAFKKYYPKKGIMGSPWVGFENFKIIFSDVEFWRVLRNTVIIGAFKIIISFIAAILVALLLNEIRMRFFKKTVQIIVTFPHFLSWVVVGGFVMNLFSRTGAINDLLALAGKERIEFLSNGKFFLGLLFTSDIWKEAGWASIIYLATMAGISPELYEAASIDGANRFQKMLYITLPGLVPAISINLIFALSGIIYGGFDQIYNMYNETVYGKGDILETYLFRSGLLGGDYSLGTALGLFNSIIGLALTLIANKIIKKLGGNGIW